MESDVTQSAWFYRSWAWLETHKKQVAWTVGAVLVLGAVAGFVSWRHNEEQVNASEELSRVIAGARPGQPPAAEAYLKVAADHPDTAAAARALLLGAARLFTDGKFAESQARFEAFLREYGTSHLAGQAHFGVAASLDAQGKTNEAIAAYKQIAERRANEVVGPQARLALGRLYDGQGNLKLARETYEQLARSDFGSIGQEAAMHLEELLRLHPELAAPDAVPTNALSMTLLEPAATVTSTVPSDAGLALPPATGTNVSAE
jgi:predicted negative regulator of RcsB-dependent stress response